MKVGSCLYAVCAITMIAIQSIFGIIGLALGAVGGGLMWGRPLIQTYLQPVVEAQLSAFAQTGQTLNFNTILDGFFTFVQPLAIPLFIVGIILFSTAICGILGACCKSKILLAVNFIITAIILVVLIVFINILAVDRQKYLNSFRDYLTNNMRSEFVGIKNSNFVTLLWNFLQMTLSCCGITNGTDFQNASSWERTFSYSAGPYNTSITLQYPLTCCKMENFQPKTINCTWDPTPTNNNYPSGCWSMAENTVTAYMSYILGGLGGIIGLHVILLLCCFLMIWHVLKMGKKVKPSAKM